MEILQFSGNPKFIQTEVPGGKKEQVFLQGENKKTTQKAQDPNL